MVSLQTTQYSGWALIIREDPEDPTLIPRLEERLLLWADTYISEIATLPVCDRNTQNDLLNANIETNLYQLIILR